MLLDYTGHPQIKRKIYTFATPDEIRAKLGSDHVAWIMRSPNPIGHARARAAGEWDANNLESMSAYERLATLIETGEIAPGIE